MTRASLGQQNDQHMHILFGSIGAALSIGFAAFMWWEATPWQPLRTLVHPAAVPDSQSLPQKLSEQDLQLSLNADPIITSSTGEPIIKRRADANAYPVAQAGSAGAIHREFKLVGVYGDVALVSPRDLNDDRLWYITEGAQLETFGEIRAIDTRVHPPIVITSKGLIVP